MALWDNDDDLTYRVVRSVGRQLSIWPSGRTLPPGWSDAAFAGPRRDCLAEIDRLGAGAGSGSGSVIVPAGTRPGSADLLAGPTGGSVVRGPSRPRPTEPIMELIRQRELPADRPAVSCGNESLTRAELLATSAGWAGVLAEAGCGPGVAVAVLMPRGLPALTAILAILDAGGAFVPLSTDDPVGKTRAVLDDCAAPIVICADEHALEPTGALAEYPGITLTEADLRARSRTVGALPPPPAPDDLAYVFYTSGTTGQPKGVEGTHGQLVNYALWCSEAFRHRPGEVTFLTAPLYFLGSLTTIFTPLLEGWPFVVAGDGATTDELLELTERHPGGLLKVTPTHVRMLTARGVPKTGLGRQLMIGSEPLTYTRELHDWMAADADRVVVNHYGLTETHGCFCHWLTGSEAIGGRVPIGRPIDNVEIYIVDRDGDPVAVGEIGEMLVGGPSIGRGYRNRPGLTAERWIPHNWAYGERLLRTGDLARLGPDGVVTVLGRADRQVKIRGHRVEPAAIEEALRARPEIKEALVLPLRADDRVTLDAYLVRAPGTDIDPASVKAALETSFPPQWIPARIAVLTEFPVSASGKVDVRALPVPQPVYQDRSPGAEAERWTRIDRLVAEAYCQVLKIDDIGLSDGFYDLGGDSMAAVEVAAVLGQALGRTVEAPTPATATVRAYAGSVGTARHG
jgi:amino acid adenylation domain-containing protein